MQDEAAEGSRGVSPVLLDVLREAQRRGLLGPANLQTMVDHAAGFGSVTSTAPRRLLDLGSGGGLPGLVLAELWPASQVVLLDGRESRVEFLRWALSILNWNERVEAVADRAELAGRSTEFRGGFDVVVARGFGPPAVTAECAAPMLEIGGTLIVSEPPEDSGVKGHDRWPDEGLALLGLVRDRTWHAPFRYQEIVQKTPCPERFPRRIGVPGKRPLF